MSKEKLSESVDSAMPRDLAPQLNSPEISGDASAVQENETEKALHTLAGFYEKIKGSSNLLEDKDAQKSLKECETVFEKLTGFDLEELSKKDAHAYFEGKKQTVYKEREDLLKKVKDLYHTINEAKKDKDKKVSPKDIKRYTYIENAWDNLSDEQKKEHAGENDSEGKGAKFNFIVWLAKNRFKNIELNCQVNNVEEVVAQGGKIDASSPLSPETFMELEEKDKNFKDSYILDKEGKQKEKIKSPESHHQTEHKKLEKEFNDLILDQMYLFNDYIKEFGEKENVKAHDYFYQKFSKLKLSLPEASEKLENISLERLEKSIQSQRQKLEKYKTVAEGFRLGQDIIELKREKRGYEKAKALREYDKMMDEPMDDFKEGLKRAGWATLSFIRHPIKGTKKGINAGWSFIKNPRKFWKKSNEGVDMVGLIKELQKPKEKDLTPALEIPEPPVTYVLPKTETAPVVEATPEPSPAIIVQPKVDVVPEPKPKSTGFEVDKIKELDEKIIEARKQAKIDNSWDKVALLVKEKTKLIEDLEKSKKNANKQEKNQKEKELGMGISVQEKSIASEGHPDRNEDAMFFDAEKKVFGVFDGIGGHAAGDIASKLARDYISEKLKGLSEQLSPDEIKVALSEILQEANEVIFQQGKINTEQRGMGTTASVVKIWEGGGERKAIIGNVGDSRVYKYSDGKIEQITLDDSVMRLARYNPDHYKDEEYIRKMQDKLSDVVDFATLTDEEARFFRDSNVISQNLGSRGVEPRMYVVDLKPGEKMVVMSDGIGDNLTNSEMAEILKQANGGAGNGAESLIDEALKRSKEGHLRAKKDDMSVIIMNFDLKADGGVPEKPAEVPVAPAVPEAIKPTEPSKEKPKIDLVAEIRDIFSIDNENYDKRYIMLEYDRLKRKYSDRNKGRLDPEELKNFDKVNALLGKIKRVRRGKELIQDTIYDILKEK